MNDFTGKTAIITEASSGIGRAAALLFAEHGARLVLAARRGDMLEALVGEIEERGGGAVARAGDVRDEGYCAALVALAEECFGGLDIALNNAGALGALGPAEDMAAADWRNTLDVNLTSAFLCAKHQMTPMRAQRSGSIIFVSSFVGHTASFSGMAAYAASKAGLVGLAQTLAVELGAHGVRVNALLPGGTDTPMGRVVAHTPEIRASIANLHALKRQAAPEEIARAALFLASDTASFVTGAALLADGGVSVARAG